MPTHVTALFKDRLTAHSAVEQLVQAGFSRDELSVVMSQTTHSREFAPSSSRGRLGSASPSGVLSAIVAEISGVTSFEGILAAGPISAALARLEGGALPGALADELSFAGVPPIEARVAWARVSDGAILVGVVAHRERAQLAKELLALSGGEALQAA